MLFVEHFYRAFLFFLLNTDSMSYAILEKNSAAKLASDEIIAGVLNGSINKNNFEYEKIRVSKKYGTGKIIKNAEVFQFVEGSDPNHEFLKIFLKTKPVRTSSGVANIAVMWLDHAHRSPHDPDKFYSCPAACVYCPQGGAKDVNGVIVQVPKSYTGCEPTTMRAIRNNYDPFLQVTNRLKQLHIIGHSTDKCELIVMGGTFTSMPYEYQKNFVKGCLDAMNESASGTIEEAQMKNESAQNRCIGLTIETRADFCYEKHIDEMLRLGCTRVEIGVQSTDDKILAAIKRGHGAEENARAIELLKKSGLKFTAHWMPGLTGLFGEVDEKREIEMFRELFENPAYRPDELKIYPVLVLPGTELYEMWNRGEYQPLSSEQMLNLLIEMKRIVPPYVRIKRVMRDISEHEAKAGASTTNLRQLAKIKMDESGISCSCIRCREVGLNEKSPESVDLLINEYEASGGREFFISYEDVENDLLLGFIRLRLDAEEDIAKIRELHVYGEMTPLGEKSRQAQHKGLGKRLLEEAETIAKSKGFNKISVTSGVGVREYYRKLGYILESNYMVKRL